MDVLENVRMGNRRAQSVDTDSKIPGDAPGIVGDTTIDQKPSYSPGRSARSHESERPRIPSDTPGPRKNVFSI